MAFSEFIEFLLWRLYVEERQHGAGQLFDLNELASELLVPVDPQWLIDAGKVLESRGLATTAFALGGYGSGMLTGEGRLYVEDRINAEGSFISRLLEHPEQYVPWANPPTHDDAVVTGKAVIRSLEEERAPALAVLADLDGFIDQVATIDQIDLPEPERHDLHADVATIRAQLTKREPNLPLVAGLLEPMASRWPFLASHVSRLSALLFS